MEPGEPPWRGQQGGQWLLGVRGGDPGRRKCDKELGFEMDLPSLSEKDGTIKISSEAQL